MRENLEIQEEIQRVLQVIFNTESSDIQWRPFSKFIVGEEGVQQLAFDYFNLAEVKPLALDHNNSVLATTFDMWVVLSDGLTKLTRIGKITDPVEETLASQKRLSDCESEFFEDDQNIEEIDEEGEGIYEPQRPYELEPLNKSSVDLQTSPSDGGIIQSGHTDPDVHLETKSLPSLTLATTHSSAQ